MPNRRSTANSLQILIMHLFGDAGSPYLIGVVSFCYIFIEKKIILPSEVENYYFSLFSKKLKACIICLT